MIAYFAKVDPRVPVYISTGEQVKFEAVSWDEGVYPPAEDRGISERLINELRMCMARGVGGLREITRDEFLALLKKKEVDPDGLERPSREEWNPRFKINKSPSPGQPAGAARVAVDMHSGAVEVTAPSVTAPGSVPVPSAATPPAIPRPVASKPKAAQKR